MLSFSFVAEFKWRGSKGNWDEGIVWRGAVSSGKPKGKGILVYPASDDLRSFADGVMEAGRMQGQWIVTFRNGTSRSYDYLDDEVVQVASTTGTGVSLTQREVGKAEKVRRPPFPFPAAESPLLLSPANTLA